MKKIIILAQFIVFIASTWSTEAPMLKLPLHAFWIDNHWRTHPSNAQPKQWRTMTNNSLAISGSASPGLNNLYWLKKNYANNRPIYLVDLRQETHLYINGLPISIFYKKDEINWGKSPAAIQAEEQAWIKQLSSRKKIVINSLSKPVAGFKTPINPFNMSINEVYSEESAAAKAGMHYMRLEVPDYHPPSPEQVDRFLAQIQTLPANSWLHIHCAGGKGRTTTFLTMIDILYNSNKDSLETIVNRQILIGGIDLLGDSLSLSKQPWKKQYHQARSNFIRLFYLYVSKAYPQKHFSEWLTKQKKGPYLQLLQTTAYFHPEKGIL